LAERVDIHQHLWTEPLIEALGRRAYCGQEAPATVDAGDRAVERRLSDLERDGIGRALVSMSCPIGIESLPRREAEPLLDGAPLFIHPGPGLDCSSHHDPSAPAWWPALTRYLFEMQGAWMAFIAEGRPAHSGLKVVFAMLAGCAPLQRERLAGRGGPACRTADPLMFYDCSSYGTHAMVRCVGVEQIVFGSDRR
jgi:hypothetical protein